MSHVFITPLSDQQLLGLTEDHLCPLSRHDDIKVHHAVVEPLDKLMHASRTAGFDLRVASGFRSYHRQRMIWNNKCRGLRPTYDYHGKLLDLARLSSQQKVYAILHWSALPGASRHHWGTDCDIYDAAAINDDYQLQLHPEEYLGDGPFAPMIRWLQEYLRKTDTPDFYCPYFLNNNAYSQVSTNNSGVAPEPWHISYRPISSTCADQLSPQLLREQFHQLSEDNNVDENSTILHHLDDIYARFIDLPDNINGTA